MSELIPGSKATTNLFMVLGGLALAALALTVSDRDAPPSATCDERLLAMGPVVWDPLVARLELDGLARVLASKPYLGVVAMSDDFITRRPEAAAEFLAAVDSKLLHDGDVFDISIAAGFGCCECRVVSV